MTVTKSKKVKTSVRDVDAIGSIVMFAPAPILERFRELCHLENAANNILIGCQMQRKDIWKDIEELGELPKGFHYRVDLDNGAIMVIGLKRDYNKGGM